MIKPEGNINLIKEKISALRGLNVEMKIMRGRKKVENYKGIVDSVYSRIFTVKLISAQGADLAAGAAVVVPRRGINTMSYSYTDVLCGNVEIKEAK